MSENKHTLLKIGILTAASCACIKAINNSISACAVSKNILYKNSEEFYHWKHGDIHYTIRGIGSPILLIHDLNPGLNTNEWKYVVKSLAENHTVYAIDLLGCGCSDRPHITYTNYLYVQLITSFIKDVIKSKTDVIASGLSASLAVMACKNDSTIINNLVMVNPVDLAKLNEIPDQKSKIWKFLLEAPLFGTRFYHILTSRSNIELNFTEKYLYNPFHMDEQLVDSIYESAHIDESDGRYLLSSIKGKYVNFNICHALKTLNNNISIIYGSGEPHCRENISLYQSINSSLKCEIISHTKHFPHVENPRLFLESVKNLVQ